MQMLTDRLPAELHAWHKAFFVVVENKSMSFKIIVRRSAKLNCGCLWSRITQTHYPSLPNLNLL